MLAVLNTFDECADTPNVFLEAVCVEVVKLFGKLTFHAAEFLLTMLRSEPMSKYHYSVFQISNFLLSQPSAKSFILGFQEIILAAHETITCSRGVKGFDAASARGRSQRSLSVAAGDLVATVIHLHASRSEDEKENKDEEAADSETSGLMVVVPSRSRPELNDALRKVLRCTPMVSDSQIQGADYAASSAEGLV